MKTGAEQQAAASIMPVTYSEPPFVWASLFLVNTVRGGTEQVRTLGTLQTQKGSERHSLGKLPPPSAEWKAGIALIKKGLFIEQKSLKVQECCFQTALLLSGSPSLPLFFFLSLCFFLQPPLTPVG